MTDFINADYEVPSSAGKFTKFEQGDNRFRILTPPIMGYECWTEENGSKSPVRTDKDFVHHALPPNWDGKDPKHFWAMVVYNYQLKRLQVMQINQVTLQKALTKLAKNEKWGNPMGYDITINKSGSGIDTEYAVLPEPKTELAPEIKQLLSDTEINLRAVYDNEDPFVASSDNSPWPRTGTNLTATPAHESDNNFVQGSSNSVNLSEPQGEQAQEAVKSGEAEDDLPF